MSYEVLFAPRAERHLAQFTTAVQKILVERAERLAADPRPAGAKKLAGRENRWRLRAGDYRIIYEIRDDHLVVLVVALGHRREVYRGNA